MNISITMVKYKIVTEYNIENRIPSFPPKIPIRRYVRNVFEFGIFYNIEIPYLYRAIAVNLRGKNFARVNTMHWTNRLTRSCGPAGAFHDVFRLAFYRIILLF